MRLSGQELIRKELLDAKGWCNCSSEELKELRIINNKIIKSIESHKERGEW